MVVFEGGRLRRVLTLYSSRALRVLTNSLPPLARLATIEPLNVCLTPRKILTRSLSSRIDSFAFAPTARLYFPGRVNPTGFNSQGLSKSLANLGGPASNLWSAPPSEVSCYAD